MVVPEAATGVRLAELVAALSLATDLGLGLPQEHVLRQTVIARRLAQAAGLPDSSQDAVFYVSLLAWTGCISDSHELARWFGDDLAVRSGTYEVDMAGLPMIRYLIGQAGSGFPPLRRLTTIGRLLAGSFQAADAMTAHCQTTGDIADRLGLDAGVRRALGQSFERWDGKGAPERLTGDQIDPVMRVVQLADAAEVIAARGGVSAAVEMLRARRGTEFDPALVDLFCADAGGMLADLDHIDSWEVSGSGEDGRPELTEDELTGVLRVFGDYADLKTPFWLGHSARVAVLAAEAATRLGCSQGETTLIERAALVHDLGAIGVSTGLWHKPGPLSATERERARRHPYLMERVLARPARLAEIGAVAALHHERLDGSGYPRGLHGDALSMAARVVAAADVCDAMGHARPHRAALVPVEIAAGLRAEVTAGRLDGEAVNAVLGAAGHRVRRRPSLPAGLSPREVEVLVLVARGLSNKVIAGQLTLSTRTVSSHIEHAYAKIGVSTRGAAAMFAMRHGLVSPDGADRKIG